MIQLANQLRDKNRAEYILYLWQMEDLMRGFDLDAQRIDREWLAKAQLGEEDRKENQQWFRDLCEMMRAEGLRERGHLQIARNALEALAELHAALLRSPEFPYYREMYYKVLPYIVEVRAKNKQTQPDRPEEGELEICFDILYGVLTLRLSKRAVSPETVAAQKDVSALLGTLSDYYHRGLRAENLKSGEE